MTDRDDELDGVARVGKDGPYLEGLNTIGFLTLWQQDPLRILAETPHSPRTATRGHAAGNDAIMLTKEQALILLEVLQKNKARIEAAIVKERVEKVKSQGWR